MVLSKSTLTYGRLLELQWPMSVVRVHNIISRTSAGRPVNVGFRLNMDLFTTMHTEIYI